MTTTLLDQQGILKDFPKNVKLSYENIVHKKVYSDFVLAIPQGKKCFAWFLKKDLYTLEISSDSKAIVEIKTFNCCFSNDLRQGTLLYGTLFQIEKKYTFAIEDVIQYKGVDVFKNNWLEKLEILRQIMKFDIKQVSYDESYLLFGLPPMKTTFDELIKEINSITHYDTKFIQFRKFDNKNVSQCLGVERKDGKYTICSSSISSSYITSMPPQIKTKRDIIYTVKPTIQPDIYLLYEKEKVKGLLKYVDVAYIPDYKTSVMMNKLFRNIKENYNLDALEESDDEDEFENPNEDKYVYLEREYDMVCSYNNKFKKWVPTKISF